jgi:RNA polymerase sigma-70 factor (ECF subfamily)
MLGRGIFNIESPMAPPLTNSNIFPSLRANSAIDVAQRDRLENLVVVFFDQFRRPMLRYLASFGLPFPDSEEVLQEVFLSLFQHLDRGKSHDNIRGWLFRVAHNLALKRRHRTLQDSEARADVAAAAFAIDPAPNPEDQMLNNQTQRRLLAALDALAEQDRRCLFLRAEGLRYREIAEILEMSLGAVSLSLARSLARIARSTER